MKPGIAPPLTHESDLGKHLADAVVEAGVQHLVFSSLENVDEITGGKKFAPHFTDKARIEQYIRRLPIKSSFIYMAFFTQICWSFIRLKWKVIRWYSQYIYQRSFVPHLLIPLPPPGRLCRRYFHIPINTPESALPVIGEMISPQEIVDTFVRVTGKKAVYSSAYTREDFLRHFPDFNSNDLLVREILGMAEYAVEYGYFKIFRFMTLYDQHPGFQPQSKLKLIVRVLNTKI